MKLYEAYYLYQEGKLDEENVRNSKTSIPIRYIDLLFEWNELNKEYLLRSTYELVSFINTYKVFSPLFLLYYSMYEEKRVELEEIKQFIGNEETEDLYTYLSSAFPGSEAEGFAHIIRKELYYRYEDKEEFIKDLYDEDDNFKKNPNILLKSLGKNDFLTLLDSLSLDTLELFLKYYNSDEVLRPYIRKALNEYIHPTTIKLRREEEIQLYSRLYEQLDFSKIDTDYLLSSLRYGYLKSITDEVNRRALLDLFTPDELLAVYKFIANKSIIVKKFGEYGINLYKIDNKPSDKYVEIYANSIIDKNSLYINIYDDLLGNNSQAKIFSDIAMEKGDEKLKLDIIDIWFHKNVTLSYYIPPFDKDCFEYLLKMGDNEMLRTYIKNAFKYNKEMSFDDNLAQLGKVSQAIYGKYDYASLLHWKTFLIIQTILNDQV